MCSFFNLAFKYYVKSFCMEISLYKVKPKSFNYSSNYNYII